MINVARKSVAAATDLLTGAMILVTRPRPDAQRHFL